MWKSLVRICIILGIIFILPPLLFCGWVKYKSYTIKRNPVYQTTMTDFEIHDEFYENITQKFRDLGVNQVHCFIFQVHPQRPSYYVYIVAKCSENADLPKAYRTHAFSDEVRVFTALKLAGANVDYDENLNETNTRFFLYKNWIVLQMTGKHSPFLFEDADKQAYLEKHIRPRSENK